MNTLFDRLKNSRNIIESNTADLIESYFPNYEIFWLNFLEPLRGDDGNWRYDTPYQLEEIGMSQYAVLKSINFINVSKSYISVGDPFQYYKNIYFHFGLIFESIKNLVRNICLTGNLLGIINLNRSHRISKFKLIKKYIILVFAEYKSSYKKMRGNKRDSDFL